MNSRFGSKAWMVAILAVGLCASAHAATTYNSTVWNADGSADGAGAGTLNGTNTVTYATTAVSNAGITFDTAAFPPSWNASPATNAGGNLAYTSTLAGVLGTPGAAATQTISFSASITNPVLLVNFAAAGTVIAIPGSPGSITPLSSNNCAPSGNTYTCVGATRTANDGFAVRVGGTFGPGTPLIFSYSDTNGANTIGFSIASLQPPTVAKAFGASTIPVGGTTSVTITITAAQPLSGVSFTDTLPGGLAFASPSALATTCGGVAVAATGPPAVLSLTGGTFAAAGTCTVSANVVGISAGTDVNSVTVSDTAAGVGNTAIATLNVEAPPTITKAFGAPQIVLLGVTPTDTTSLTFTVTNPAGNPAPLTGLAFTDTLPSGLVVATPNGLAGSCGGGSIAAAPGGNSISLTGATLAAGASCVFSVNVRANGIGTQVNTTSTITATGPVALTGPAATATIQVVFGAPTSSYQINYLPAAGTGIAGGYIDISNDGSLGADAFGPLAGTTGRICVNVYTFTADEQESECCSCLVTPNALVHLTAADLIGNPGNGVTPTLGLVVKLLATIPGPGVNTQGAFTSSACNAAQTFTAANLAPGMTAWATKFHGNATASPATVLSLTETPFSKQALSQGELTKLTNLCQFLSGNQSGAGLCKACSLGGLGAGKR